MKVFNGDRLELQQKEAIIIDNNGMIYVSINKIGISSSQSPIYLDFYSKRIEYRL